MGINNQNCEACSDRCSCYSVEFDGAEDLYSAFFDGAINCFPVEFDSFQTIKTEGTYIFRQETPSTEWEIQHNLGYFPSVTITKNDGTVVIGEILYFDKNKIIVTFQTPFAGIAYLN